MSCEEGKFFSIGGMDRTVRCWNQRDKEESYQFIIPGKVRMGSNRLLGEGRRGRGEGLEET